MRMLKAVLRAAAAIAVITLVLSTASCGDAKDAAEVCIDQQTRQRVDDSQCEQPVIRGAFVWWYITSGYVIPAYGWPVAYGYATPPRGYVVVHHVPSAGGVMEKRSRRQTSTAPVVKPTSASTQPPASKKQSKWRQPPPANRQQPPASTKQRWQQPPPANKQGYKPPPNKPPTYTKYR